MDPIWSPKDLMTSANRWIFTGIFGPIQIFDVVVLNDFLECSELGVGDLGDLFFLVDVLGQLFDEAIDLEDWVGGEVLFCSVVFLALVEV